VYYIGKEELGRTTYLILVENSRIFFLTENILAVNSISFSLQGGFHLSFRRTS